MVRILDIDGVEAVVKPGAKPTALAISLALGACADAPRCPPLELCDVQTRACQRRALEHAACLRGRGESPDLNVSVVTLDRADYIDEAERAGDEESEAQQQMRSGLALFELAAPPEARREARVSRARLVGGFYDSVEQRITIIGDGRTFRSAGNVLLLVHEMVHALQDAAGELDRSTPSHSLDQALAGRALVEGEATLLDDEAAADGYGFSFEELDYGRALRAYRNMSLLAMAASDSPFDVASMRFPYAFGASYLWPLRREQGAGALGKAFSAPPVSSYAVIYGDPNQPALRENDLGEVAAPVLPDLTRVGCYHLGRFLYAARARAGRLALPFGHEFVADTLCVFADQEGSISATWRIRFDSEAAAERAAGESPVTDAAASHTEVDGTDVWWAAGFRQALPRDLSWEAAPAQDFGFEEEPTSRRIHCPRRAR